MLENYHVNFTRDVNSLEMAYPGRESQFSDLDRDSLISPEYIPFNSVIWVGSHKRGGGWSQAGPRQMFLADAGTPSIDRHSGRWHTWNVAKRQGDGATGGSVTREAQWLIGPGQHAKESLNQPPPSDNWSTSREDGRAKRRAVARSPAPWHTYQNADVERDGVTQSPTRCRVWETTGPPSDAARWSADMSHMSPPVWHINEVGI